MANARNFANEDQVRATKLFDELIRWTNADHEDSLTLSRNQCCYMRDEIERLRKISKKNELEWEQMQAVNNQLEGALKSMERRHEEALALKQRECDKQLAALQWTPITAENLPKVGDEVIRWKKDILGDFQQVLSVVDLFEWASTDYVAWTAAGWTHFRPIAPPAPRSKA